MNIPDHDMPPFLCNFDCHQAANPAHPAGDADVFIGEGGRRFSWKNGKGKNKGQTLRATSTIDWKS